MSEHDDILNQVDLLVAQAAKDKQNKDINSYKSSLKRAIELLYRYAKNEQNKNLKNAAVTRADYLYDILTKDLKKVSPKMTIDETEDEDSKEAESFNQVERPTTRLNDVIGLDEAKKIINEQVIKRYVYPDLYTKDDFNKGILLYGVPGTGKTLFARAVAGEINAPFYCIRPEDVRDKYVGESEKNIARLFDEMRKNPLSILFIDEADSFFGRRTDDSSGVDVLITNALITQLDGFEQHDEEILVIAATNRPDAFDSAAIRRFDVRIRVDLPNEQLRKMMLEKYLNTLMNKESIFEIDLSDSLLDDIAKRTARFSGDDIKNLCRDVKNIARHRVIELRDKGEEVLKMAVTRDDFYEALKKRKSSVSKKDELMIDLFDRTFADKGIVDDTPNDKDNVKESEDKNNDLNNQKLEAETIDNNQEEDESFIYNGKPYVFPSIDILHDYFQYDDQNYENYIDDISNKIINKYQEFSLDVKIVSHIQSTTITRLNLELGRGVSVSNVKRYQDDIETCLGSNIRFSNANKENPYLAIEIENPMRNIVGLKGLIMNLEPRNILIGEKLDGSPYQINEDDFTHLLIAGTTGSGKSIFLHSFLSSLLFRYSPEYIRLVLFDPKVVEFSRYKGLPHLYKNVITDASETLKRLNEVIVEMEFRYQVLEKYGCRNLQEYNDLSTKDNLEKLPMIFVIIDEFGDLILQKKDIEMAIQRLCSKGRAAGIKLILATQRPSVNVITGVIKANFPLRIAFTVASGVDSKVIIDEVGAEKLCGKGDMLLSDNGTICRLQAPFISSEESHRLINEIIVNN